MPPGDTLITGTPWWAETNSRSPLHSNPLYISRLLSLVPYATTQSYSSNPFFLSHVRSVAVTILMRAMYTRGLYTTKSTRGHYTTQSHTDETWGAWWDCSSLMGLTNPGCAPLPLCCRAVAVTARYAFVPAHSGTTSVEGSHVRVRTL